MAACIAGTFAAELKVMLLHSKAKHNYSPCFGAGDSAGQILDGLNFGELQILEETWNHARCEKG